MINVPFEDIQAAPQSATSMPAINKGDYAGVSLIRIPGTVTRLLG